MYCVREVTDRLYWVGANDHRLTLFENIHPIPKGFPTTRIFFMDEKTVLFDTIDWSCCRQLVENVEHLPGDRALDGKLFADEVNFERDWLDEARRYYTNIVGKYGSHTQLLLKKAAGILDQIKLICPLHGPVWRKDIPWFVHKYDLWSRYEPEEKGVLIAYASMYGNTESAAQALAARLCEKGVTNVAVYDVSNTHVSTLIAETFRYSHLVLASVTYNLGIYPVMHNFLADMKALNVQNRTVAIVENGSWACKSGELMEQFVRTQMKNMTVLDRKLSLASSLPASKAGELEALADAIVESVQKA